MISKKRKTALGALICLLVILIAIECIYPLDVNAKYVTAANEITYKKYMFIPYGDDEGSLAHFVGEGDKAVNLGPNSFAVAEDGSVFILDDLRYQIKHYSPTGTFMYSIALPKNGFGLDFEVSGDTVYLMNGDNCLYKKSTADAEWVKLGTYSIMRLAGLYAEENEVYGRTWDGADMHLTGFQLIENAEKTNISQSVDKKQTYIKKDGVEYTINYSAEPLGSFIIKTVGDTAYTYEFEALMKNYPYAELRIGKYVNGVRTETALAAPMSYYINSNPFKKLYIADSGEVYQMLPLESGVLISVVPWFPDEKTRITDVMIKANETKG
jgi:hypothetical protein